MKSSIADEEADMGCLDMMIFCKGMVIKYQNDSMTHGNLYGDKNLDW